MQTFFIPHLQYKKAKIKRQKNSIQSLNKPIKNKYKKAEQSSDSDTLSAYSENLQWEYTLWIIHNMNALIYCGNNIHLIKRFCFAAVGGLHIVYCYKLMAEQRK